VSTPVFVAPVKVCPHCGAQAQTTELKCPACGKGYKKKNRTFLKVFLGVVVAVIVLAVGCTALIGGAANEVAKELDAEQKAHAISASTFDAIRLGATKQQVLAAAAPATPADAQEFQQEGVLDSSQIDSSCIYFNRDGGSFGDIYQFCFTGNRLESKNAY
jgi:hypothetical protein